MVVAFSLTPMMAARLLPPPLAGGPGAQAARCSSGSAMASIGPIERLYGRDASKLLRCGTAGSCCLAIIGSCMTTHDPGREEGRRRVPAARTTRRSSRSTSRRPRARRSKSHDDHRRAPRAPHPRDHRRSTRRSSPSPVAISAQANVGEHLRAPRQPGESRQRTQADRSWRQARKDDPRAREERRPRRHARRRAAGQRLLDRRPERDGHVRDHRGPGPRQARAASARQALKRDREAIPGVTDLDSSLLDPVDRDSTVRARSRPREPRSSASISADVTCPRSAS